VTVVESKKQYFDVDELVDEGTVRGVDGRWIESAREEVVDGVTYTVIEVKVVYRKVGKWVYDKDDDVVYEG
jgi:hypothetical protein